MTGTAAIGPGRQRGIAVLTAMLVVTIAAMLAADLVWELSLNVRRTENLLLRDQAEQVALGAELWAADILRRDLVDGGPNSADHRDEDWAQNIPALPVEGGTVDGFMEDAHGRFDLNNLVDRRGRRDEVAIQQFVRLLTLLNLSPDIADAVVDWIDIDQTPSGFGAEDDVYTSLTPPYLAANFWFTSVSELRAVRGIDEETYEKLAPHVTALPVLARPQRINVNTATPEVLASLWPGISAEQAAGWQDTIYYDRSEFADRVKDELDPDSTPDYAAMDPYLDMASNHFTLNVTVSIGTVRLAMYSLLERRADGIVIVRLRSFDTS